MGSPFGLIFYTEDSARAASLARRCFALVDSLNTVFSDYLPSSELNRLSASSGQDSFVTVSPLLFRILSQSREAWKKSRGSFDITIGPLSRLWRAARREKKFPGEEQIRTAKASVGFRFVTLQEAGRRVGLARKGMQLDLGGIAKGYVAEEVIRLLEREGITSALVDAGGDIVCSGPPPGKEGWTIGVNLPQQTDVLLDRTITLAQKAVATSGDAYQFTEHRGKKYSHILDPRTGYGVTSLRNVTIIAPDGATADWLATACSILPLRQARRLVRAEKSDLLLSVRKKGKLRLYSTKGRMRQGGSMPQFSYF